uniref:Succinate dehydrogenase subunit C n=1 Tax=Podosphaera xanthii TaxID=135283 RepID=A0A7G1GGY9_9PEZI|nr:succinate dehydrogenase subunit C [Podosphaera xanthii]UBY12708.1 succinate dehydrogenase subunit C [Podosphaera xanthii]BCA25610.1 succinate dehydrogenase subunit C [Podosphaera xanthii]
MLAPRTIQQSLLGSMASRQFSPISQMPLKRLTIPLTFKLSSQLRPVTTQIIKPADSYNTLIAQRKNRPTSPHLQIYRPQITWYLSVLNRITGCVISGGFYVFGAAYLVSPLFAWHLDSASLATAFGALPLAMKLGLKSLVALPFTFHSINGIRHLTWDLGKAFSNQAVIKTGWTVVALSVASALALVTLI